MNIIQVKIDFEQGTCQKQGISVVTGDYNSTKIVFEFNDSATGTKIFKMKDPNDNLVYADEIVNNEVVLVGYEEEEGEIETYSLFGEEGDYTFEVSLYQNNGKLTSVCDYITAEKEQVIVDGEEVQERITLFDNLMNELNQAIVETNNLNIDAEKVDTTTTVTITKKDGTPKQVEINDGVSLENIKIDNRNLLVTYGGETDNLGQIVPNIQVGTTTTGVPSSQASVVNVGTDLNPILNFTIPKGDAGAISIQIVSALPEIGQEDTMYLVPYDEITVEELPETGLPDTIYVVSSTNKRYEYKSNQWIEIKSDNKYKEYVWINNDWEQIGAIGIEVDLTDYVKNTDYATTTKGGVVIVNSQYGTGVDSGYLKGVSCSYEAYQTRTGDMFITKTTLENAINGKGLVSNTNYASGGTAGVIKISNTYFSGVNSNGSLYALNRTYQQYLDGNDLGFISKSTLENVITGKKLETENNKVTSISSSSTDTQYPSAKCVYDLVGNVETLLTTLDIGGGISGN